MFSAIKSPQTPAHDRFNYRRPNVNYDQIPRKAPHRRQMEGSEVGDEDKTTRRGFSKRISRLLFRSNSVDLLSTFQSLEDIRCTTKYEKHNRNIMPGYPKLFRNKIENIFEDFLRTNPRYSFISTLGKIGFRKNKHWFLVQDSVTSINRFAIIQTYPTSVLNRMLDKTVLMKLFIHLYHPYILPVLDVDIKESRNETHVIIVLPFNKDGSLKDQIHKTRWNFKCNFKYSVGGTELSIPSIRLYGRQILEALLFLKDSKFPAFDHLHSANIVIQRGVARIMGLENTIFGCRTQCMPFLYSEQSSQVLCFGHLLFEMSLGYEFRSKKPSASDMLEIHKRSRQLADVLRAIFFNDAKIELEDVARCPFFRNVELREANIKRNTNQFISSQDSRTITELLVRLQMQKNENIESNGRIFFNKIHEYKREESKLAPILKTYNGYARSMEFLNKNESRM